MTWNHRVVRQRHPSHLDDEPDEWSYAIHEAYYNKQGEVWGITTEPSAPCGETLGELRKTLSWMLQALDQPILDHSGPWAESGFEVDEAKYFAMTDEEIDQLLAEEEM